MPGGREDLGQQLAVALQPRLDQVDVAAHAMRRLAQVDPRKAGAGADPAWKPPAEPEAPTVTALAAIALVLRLDPFDVPPQPVDDERDMRHEVRPSLPSRGRLKRPMADRRCRVDACALGGAWMVAAAIGRTTAGKTKNPPQREPGGFYADF